MGRRMQPRNEIERQRAGIEAAFREWWAPPDAGNPRVLAVPAWAEACRVISHGGRTSIDQVTFEAVRGGARPGDLLPPRQPDRYTDDVTDAEVIITGVGPQRRVAVLFSHRHFPGVRFGHRFPPDPDAEALEQIWLKEEIETGALNRMMQSQPPADETGIIWTTWEDPDQD